MSRLVPKLRFKEFSGEWEEKRLDEVSTFINEKIQLNQISIDNYISTENILPNFNGITKSSKLPNIANVTKFKINDVLISNIRPYLKKIWLADIAGGASNDIIVTRAKADNNYKYLLYIVQNDKFIDYVMQGAKGVKMPRGDIALIKKYPLFVPTPKEQQKIANTLSSLDSLIEAQNQKVEALKRHKTGLMQQLFPSEGERVPKLRFKEFSGEWEEKSLGDICNYIVDNRGKTPPITNKGIPLIEVNSMEGKNINYTKVSKFVSDKTFNNWFRNYLKNGDILFSTVGRTAICSLYSDDTKAGIAQNIVGLRCANENFTFVFYLLTEKRNNLKFKSIEMGAVQPSVKVSQMINLKFKLPKNPKEQQKVANTLSSLDTLIEAQKQKVEALKEHKKGLMQQMLVSGEG